MLKSISFICIPVSDQAEALKFWTEKVGLSVFTNQPFDENQNWIELQISGADTKLVLFTKDEQKDLIGKISNITFNCESTEKTYELLSARGVEFLSPPTKEIWGSYAIFKDLDGNTFVVSSAEKKQRK